MTERPNAIRTPFQVSMRVGFVVTAVIAVAIAALRAGDWPWARVLFTLTLGMLLLALLAACYRAGSSRAFWAGFALFGWTYFAISNLPALQSSKHQLIDAQVASALRNNYPIGHSWHRLQVDNIRQAEIGSFPQIIGHTATLVFSALGGVVGLYLYLTSTHVDRDQQATR